MRAEIVAFVRFRAIACRNIKPYGTEQALLEQLAQDIERGEQVGATVPPSRSLNTDGR